MANKQDKNLFIGQKIKEARESAGKSQKELAEALDYESATAISLIEAGERKVRAEDLVLISRFLNRSIDYFLGSEGLSTDVLVALRADKDLKQEDKEAISYFIELAKSRKKK